MSHIYSDFKIMAEIMDKADDMYRRMRRTCAPYCSGTETDGCRTLIYVQCDLVLGMCYRTNVVPIGIEMS